MVIGQQKHLCGICNFGNRYHLHQSKLVKMFKYRIRRNFRGKGSSSVKFSLRLIFVAVKICPHENLAPRIIDTTNLETWMQSTRSCACVDTTFTTTPGKQQLEKRYFAWESRGTVMTGMLWSSKWTTRSSLAWPDYSQTLTTPCSRVVRLRQTRYGHRTITKEGYHAFVCCCWSL